MAKATVDVYLKTEKEKEKIVVEFFFKLSFSLNKELKERKKKL